MRNSRVVLIEILVESLMKSRDFERTVDNVLQFINDLKTYVHDNEKKISDRKDVFVISNSTDLKEDVSDSTGQMH